MSIVNWLKPVVMSTSTIVVVYECRRCGATLDSASDQCTFCGPTDAVRYEID